MKVFVEVSAVAATAGRSELSEYVAPLEDAGATGVTVSDHLFYTRDGLPRSSGVRPACDPLTTLASVAALSDRLELQTVVVNTAWIHPALLLLRQFTQLAVLAGGERVTAGLVPAGAPRSSPRRGCRCHRSDNGWNGWRRFSRWRQLYDTGWANMAGTFLAAEDLTLSPVPDRAPRLLVGGGSDRALRMAGC